MYSVTLKKRQTTNHNGIMIVDANFADKKSSFNKSFQFPIDATEDEIKVVIKTWMEEKEEDEKTIFDSKVPVDFTGVVTDRVAFKEYIAEKQELIEISELVALGAIDANDQAVKDIKAKVKTKYKPEFAKMKKK